jgi:hypothetical protein
MRSVSYDMGARPSFMAKNKKWAHSTENGTNNAWNQSFNANNGNLNNNNKVNNKIRVRPVSAQLK